MDLKVKTAQTFEDFSRLSSEIIDADKHVIGFDTETALSNKNTKVSLIQIYNGDCCYLFQISKLDSYPKNFQKIMGRDFIKVGFDVEMDITKLRKYNDLDVYGYVDIQHLLKSLDYPFSSMQQTVAYFFDGFEMSKNVKHDSWDNDIISGKSLEYAAIDAYFSWACYFKLMKMDTPSFHQCVNSDQYIDDRMEILEMLRKTQNSSEVNLASAIKIICNSYRGWANKYPDNVKKEYSQKVLDKLCEEEHIQICQNKVYLNGKQPLETSINLPSFLEFSLDEPNTKHLPKSPTHETQEKDDMILEKIRKVVSVKDIKRKSLINILANSYSGWADKKIGEKRVLSIELIENLEKTKKITKNSDGTYDIFAKTH